eukprot:TRINITY_DN6628_c0_g1_i4.p1 TRINITY_DN6628_c0_g1~~TRINITY_DN6628_c0_g1_i4.p1  ORF type:complete len:484 (+),score=122.39 TRINITY_DN6628_c0_g1_i4:89-1540(+)
MGMRILAFLCILFVLSYQDPTFLFNILNQYSASKLWNFQGAAVPTKKDIKIVPDIPDRSGIVQAKHKVQAKTQWETVVSFQFGKDDNPNGAGSQGLALWFLVEEFGYTRASYTQMSAALYGGRGNYKGLGVFILPEKGRVIGKESMAAQSFDTNNVGDKALGCNYEAAPGDKMQVKVAFSDGVILTYLKPNKEAAKYKLCFTSSGLGRGLRDFYFAISSGNPPNVSGYTSVTEAKIFSDMPEDKENDPSPYLNTKDFGDVHARDILRSGRLNDAHDYSSSKEVDQARLEKEMEVNTAYLFMFKKKMKEVLQSYEIALRWIHAIKYVLPTAKDGDGAEEELKTFKVAFDKMRKAMKENEARFAQFRKLMEETPLRGRIDTLMLKINAFERRLGSIERTFGHHGEEISKGGENIKKMVEEEHNPKELLESHLEETARLVKKKGKLVRKAAKTGSFLKYVIIFAVIMLALIGYAFVRLRKVEDKAF